MASCHLKNHRLARCAPDSERTSFVSAGPKSSHKKLWPRRSDFRPDTLRALRPGSIFRPCRRWPNFERLWKFLGTTYLRGVGTQTLICRRAEREEQETTRTKFIALLGAEEGRFEASMKEDPNFDPGHELVLGMACTVTADWGSAVVKANKVETPWKAEAVVQVLQGSRKRARPCGRRF